MTPIEMLTNTDRRFLTDGGFETSMFFHEGLDAPEFAAIVLMDNQDARKAMRRYFDRFLHMAENVGAGFVLDTNTWRGCVRWGSKLGVSSEDMIRLNRDAVGFAKEIQAAWQSRVSPILLNGVVGPAGDGYAPDRIPNVTEALSLHRPQIGVFAQENVDLISALTMTNVAEATAICMAAKEKQLPVVISFTVETDAHLPSGESLGDAIDAVDKATESAPLYYMVNCAHPDHFRSAIKQDERWVTRIGGVRANASRLSHAELDQAETLDEGNPSEFGELHAELIRLLPNLRVLGGCCGTDHRHVECVASHMAA